MLSRGILRLNLRRLCRYGLRPRPTEGWIQSTPPPASRRPFLFSMLKNRSVNNAEALLVGVPSQLRDLNVRGCIDSLQKSSNALMESANVPFDGIESEQHRRDLYFRLQVQLATIARTQNDVNEANEIIDGLIGQFSALSSLCSRNNGRIHSRTMANLLKEKLVISVMGVNPALDHHHHHHQAPQLSHPGALSRPNVSVSLLSDIESKFEPFSSFADRDDEEVVSFYSQLAKAHLPLHSDLCKEIIQRNLLFDRDGDRDGNGDLRQQLRQLEGRHCLAVCNFMNGAVDVVPFQRLEKEYLDLMNAFEDNIDNDVRERLAGKLTSLVENIAYIAIVQERFGDAAVTLRECISSLPSLLENCHENIGHCRFLLAVLLHQQNENQELAEVLKDFLCSFQKASSLKLAQEATQLAEIAFMRFHQSNPELSLGIATHALAVRSAWFDPESDVECGLISKGIGSSLQSLRRFEESLEHLRRALAVCTGSVKGTVYHVGVMIALASSLLETDRAADCIDLLKEAVSLCETNEGDDFVSVHHSALRLLSRAQASQKCYQEAKEAMEKAVRIQRRIEDKSIQLAVDLQDLGAILNVTKDRNAAVNAFEESLAVFQTKFEPEHRVIASSRRLLANALLGATQYERALQEFEQCLGVLEATVPTQSFVPALHQYAELLAIMNRHDEAKALHLKIRSIMENRDQ